MISLPQKLRELPIGFMVATAAIFGWYELKQTPEPGVATIRITRELIHEVVADREAVEGRELETAELRQLVEQYVDEEVLLREAVAQGMDCSGCDGRRHLISRALYVFDDPIPEPTEAQLVAYHAQQQDDLMLPDRRSFHHVYFKAEPSPAAVAGHLSELREGKQIDNRGDRYWMGSDLASTSEAEVAAVMGPEFARDLFALPLGSWEGPLQSSRGWHLVRVDRHQPARPATLDEVRPIVQQSWERDRRLFNRQMLLASLRPNYEVDLTDLADLL